MIGAYVILKTGFYASRKSSEFNKIMLINAYLYKNC